MIPWRALSWVKEELFSNRQFTWSDREGWTFNSSSSSSSWLSSGKSLSLSSFYRLILMEFFEIVHLYFWTGWTSLIVSIIGVFDYFLLCLFSFSSILLFFVYFVQERFREEFVIFELEGIFLLLFLVSIKFVWLFFLVCKEDLSVLVNWDGTFGCDSWKNTGYTYFSLLAIVHGWRQLSQSEMERDISKINYTNNSFLASNITNLE